MKIIDENGIEITNPDMTVGYLVDDTIVHHDAVEMEGHYTYTELKGGGQLQHYVIDVPPSPAYDEVTAQKYIPYTQEELDKRNEPGVIEKLIIQVDEMQDAQTLTAAQVQAVSERGDFVEDVIAEMAMQVYNV